MVFLKHIKAETKWPPFRRRHLHFLERKLLHFNAHFAEICSRESDYRYATTGSDNGLAPDRRQVNIRINAGPLLLTHMYVTRLQWVNSLRPSDAYMRQ